MGSDRTRPQDRFGHFMASSWYFHGRHLPLNSQQDPSRNLLQKIYYDERAPLSGMLAFDQKTWLPENLMAKADKILMSHSLEGRFPFLTTGIVEFAASLPDSLKMDAIGGKSVLRKAFSESLPPSVISRKKMGFSVPVPQLLERLKDRFRYLLESKEGPCSEYIDYGQLIEDFNDHFSGRREQSLWLWTVLVLLQWQSGLGRSLQQIHEVDMPINVAI
jgi:asparagine synthase (glutamine-hydrolysing)